MAGTQPVIFWDFDGTLAERAGMWAGVLADVVNEHLGRDMYTREPFRPYLRSGFPWHEPTRPHLELNHPDAWWSHVEPVLTAALGAVHADFDRPTLRRLVRRVRECFIDATRGWMIYPDARTALEFAHSHGFRNAVISNHVPELPDLIRGLGLDGCFDFVITSAAVGYEKPHAEIYRIALRRAGVTGGWMIGDNPRADVLGAEAVGLTGILIRRPGDLADTGGARHIAGSLTAAVDCVVRQTAGSV